MTIENRLYARGRRPGAAIGLAVGLLATAGAIYAAAPARAPYLQAFPNFSPNLAPQLPGNVDTQLKTDLENAGKFAQVQREFDLYSWQMFLALAWPTNNQGQAAPRLTDMAFGAAALDDLARFERDLPRRRRPARGVRPAGRRPHADAAARPQRAGEPAAAALLGPRHRGRRRTE